MTNTSIGLHICLDSVLNNSSNLNNIDYFYNFIEEVSELLEMTLVSPPIIFRFPNSAADYIKIVEQFKQQSISNEQISYWENIIKQRKTDYGVSGIGIWSTSHIAFHTWKESNLLSLDAYSCMLFDKDKFLNYIFTKFDMVKSNTNVLIINRKIGAPMEISTEY